MDWVVMVRTQAMRTASAEKFAELIEHNAEPYFPMIWLSAEVKHRGFYRTLTHNLRIFDELYIPIVQKDGDDTLTQSLMTNKFFERSAFNY
jgi:hypothetical protein